MWPSLNIGEFNKSLDMGHETLNIIASSLTSHPNVNEDIAKSIAAQTIIISPESVPETVYAPFCITGAGWFEDRLGKSASDVVKQLRKARRLMKDSKAEIDDIIDNVRKIKSMEVDATIKQLGWGADYDEVIRQLGVSDRDLKSLRLFGNTRKSGLVRACNTWAAATDALHKLDEFEDVWGEEEKNAWVNAMQMKQDARKMWRNSLHQIDNLSKEQQKWMKLAKEEITNHGSMTARAITENLIEKGISRLGPARLSKLLNMYGEEINIVKGHRKGEYMCLSRDGLIIKDPWAYAAGFLDADGYITITERGEPRAGFLATGDRGKLHCEQLHKNIGAGILQLDQKIYSNSQKSQHRVSFYSKDDLTKLLGKITPHLQMKDMQAKAVMAFMNEKDPVRKKELKRFVQFSNRDGTTKGEDSLREWGVDRDTVMSWAEGL
jgi:F0F1-type ATP synthase membrane subunit b/b'